MAIASTKSAHQTETHRGHAHRDHRSPAQKVAAVIRLLKGEPAELLSEELGVSGQRLERWQSDFLAAGALAMAKKKRSTLYAWLTEHTGSFLRWLGLILALFVTIAVLGFLIRYGSPE